MPTPAKTARERAEGFLRDAVEFRLGPLVTEASHPRSTELSQVARQDAAAGLAVLFDVDRDVVEAYDRWSRSGQPEALRDDLARRARGRRPHLLHRLRRHRPAEHPARVHLARLLAGPPRARPRDARRPTPGRTGPLSVMAGGDYALIKSVEGFEDFAPFGRKQIADLGVREGRRGLRHHRGRRDLLRDRHRLAGARGRRAGRLRLQQPRRGAARPTCSAAAR